MRDVTLLWALRSPCNLGCRYCYFGTIEEHRLTPPTQPGQLSHLSRDDLTHDEITAFASTLGQSAVRRVFLAGGEPLIWPHTLALVETLRSAGIDVVLCTNGIPLNRPEITQRIVDLGVQGVSVSLDSADPEANDQYRPSRNGTDAWPQVVSGIQRLLTARGNQPLPRVGLYAVITRRNLPAVCGVAELGAELGVDYYVPQPISLAADHPLHQELSLRAQDAADLRAALDELHRADLPITLPAPAYPGQFVASIATTNTARVRRCFGGDTLFFIQPDGAVWDCPSTHKINATLSAKRRNIRGRHATDLFGVDRVTCPADCALASRDCVNMWPLTGFDRFVHHARTSTPEEPPWEI
jgi:MoaA/NifB/PqqE/SkfB family radical SAM enzyme